MYESPINIFQTTERFSSRIEAETEKMIFSAIQGVGVNVNKQELLKALAYDRQQYQKGYEDGIRAFTERLIEERNKYERIYDIDDFICNLANEMLGYVAFEVTCS